MDKQKLLLFGVAAAIRLLLFTAFPSLPTILTNRVEISTPVSSYKRLLEGVFLYTHNIPPYDGGVFHQAPLLLPLFSVLDPFRSDLPTALLYIALDLLGANALTKIADSGEASSPRLYTSPRKDLKYGSLSVAAAFLLNPFTIATCVARSTTAFSNAFILQAVASAANGKSLTAILALSFASYLSLYPVLLFPPLILLCYDRYARYAPKDNLPNSINFAIAHAIGAASTLAALLFTSYLISGSWQFLSATYGTYLTLPDLTPNVGLWWYFFTEMFDSFRSFFLGVFWLHTFSYLPGITIRFRKQPLFVIVVLTGISSVFIPYPSIGDVALFLGLLPLYRHVFPLMTYGFLTTAVVLYASLLGPAFYHLWIYAGSGNANFFYAITLVWSLGLTVLLADTLTAVLKDELECERPEMKGKEIKAI